MSEQVNRVERELDWNDSIENDGQEYTLLPEGDYDFVVESYERGRHAGSEKLPPCKKAVVYLKIDAPQGSTTIRHQLFLHTKTEGLLCAFFTGIGQRKKGEKLIMDWNKVVGARGRCKLGVRCYKKDDGSEGKSNEIKKFYEPAATTQPAGYTPGNF